jgi:hypothetical protein
VSFNREPASAFHCLRSATQMAIAAWKKWTENEQIFWIIFDNKQDF